MYHFCQVNFDNIIKKHSFSNPFEARIVRINLAEDYEKIPCLKVEIHGIITEETGVKYL